MQIHAEFFRGFANTDSNAVPGGVMPAQALSYKLGEYTIRQLREKAEAQLGVDFDVRAFHDFILALGSVPLDVLGEEVDRWLAGQR